jgi:hypothetical protein
MMKTSALLSVAMVTLTVPWGCSSKIDSFRGRWQSTLAADIVGTDKILIRNGDMNAGREPVYFTIVDPKEVQQFLANIVVDEDRSKLSCACLGWKAVEFYRGDALLARLGACSAGHFKYSKWPCDAILQEASYKFLQDKYFGTLPGKEGR